MRLINRRLWCWGLCLALSACQAPQPEPTPRPMLMMSAARALEIFRLSEAPNGELDPAAVGEHATAEVYYPMGPGDAVRVTWQGTRSHTTETKTVAIATVLRFQLPRAWIEENLGHTVVLNYAYRVGGTGAEQLSAPLTLQVLGSANDPAFQVVEAVDGVLNISRVAQDATAQVYYAGLAANDTVQVTWDGVVTRTTAAQVVTGDQPVRFALPRAWLLENLGRRVSVSYRYKVQGQEEWQVSAPIELTLTSDSIENGKLVAARLDARYNDTRNDCDGRAAYYCNGVLMRVTGYGASFHSWNPSPNSVSSGGVSFSYIRRDVGMQYFSWAASMGVVFKDFDSALQAGDRPIRLLCAFPSDAQTLFRANQGCGASRFYPTTSLYCSSLGVDTLAKWISHYHAVSGGDSRYQHQCAFASNKDAFALSVAVRAHFSPPVERPQHNEIMLETWPQDIPLQLPLEAIFYANERDAAGALAGAKYIQEDYYNSTRKVLPVVRVLLGDGIPSTFSFHLEDQALMP